MKFIKNIVAAIFAIWALFWFVFTMLLILVPTWILGFVKEPRRTYIFIDLSRIWMGVFLPLAGIRLRIIGTEHFAPGQNYVVVCNHNSFMDVPVTSPGIPGGNKTIAKIEMARIPLFGIVYRRGSVLVDRKSEESRLHSYANMKDVLAMGLHMCIYPEGTRNRTGKPLKDFKEGAFRLAIETGKPVIPAVLFNTARVLPPNRSFYFWPGTIYMQFLPPVSVEGLQVEDAPKLRQQVFDTMWQAVEKGRSE